MDEKKLVFVFRCIVPVSVYAADDAEDRLLFSAEMDRIRD